ncbi:uncharacterized protein LOC127241397 [Andrographis paniculata]|uniref:uncharacterized protein LOC127241397 n=1 Tax=Andrographis paniculata TaxID=175694 RepID=UPI0021E942EA|nr:uncharacterized protein LOC127241397 [Andrographis paniculata]
MLSITMRFWLMMSSGLNPVLCPPFPVNVIVLLLDGSNSHIGSGKKSGDQKMNTGTVLSSCISISKNVILVDLLDEMVILYPTCYQSLASSRVLGLLFADI